MEPLRCTLRLASAGGAQPHRRACALLRRCSAAVRQRRITHETLARAVDLRGDRGQTPRCYPATRQRTCTRNPRARRHTSPHAAAATAGETHTYEADQDGDLNLQLTMVSFADAKAKKGETYVVYAAADDGTVACVYQTPWRNG